ncbi:hypothetical protein C8R41DRAFT_869969 [Lentinula lateritia]|uniref:Uncharacterized protein n=1 Tax=Lentinula lateritia TaxID=40482 RepID=A0ABQ8V5A6_9AGAR|nr:hypothetical protein C8R41DRAFT_869969 [Lentinula lateritia]
MSEQDILAIILLPDNPQPIAAKIPSIPSDEYGNPSATAVHDLLKRKHYKLGLDYLFPVVVTKFVNLTNAETKFVSRMHVFGWGDPELPLHNDVCEAENCSRGEGEAYWRVPILAICVSEDGKAQSAKVEDAALLMTFFQRFLYNLKVYLQI